MAGLRTTVIIPPTTELHRQEIEIRVQQLREFTLGNERWFNTPQEVVDYLNECGVRSTHGKKVTQRLLMKFRKHMGFPYATFTMRRTTIVTSNVLIMAWLWAMRIYKQSRYSGPSPRRRNAVAA